eukprot:GFKZ01012328.1.p1 GENE.GFKZ01012328.1~~GFKZ01012328.1.p1  ORF type:complete len:380 (+),score=55.75 GFKZ01012328.1:133-1272(+)
MTHKYSSVVLGFAEPATASTSKPQNFASKAGGEPVWLYRGRKSAPLPPRCGICGQRQRFVLQIYAPVDEGEVGHEEGFHRVLYVCICENVACQRNEGGKAVSVLRGQLSRHNRYYEYYGGESDEDGVTEEGVNRLDLCAVCGFGAEKKCGGCRKVSYCSKECQVVDWKGGQKEECGEGTGGNGGREKWRWREWDIVTDVHPTPPCSDSDSDSESDGDGAQDEGEIVGKGIGGTFQDADEDELPEDLFKGKRKRDPVFEKFQRVVGLDKAQVIRYERGGRPLVVRSGNDVDTVGKCDRCGGDRVFEMQIMPQLVWYLSGRKDRNEGKGGSIGEVARRLREDMDWGTILIFSCERSCQIGEEYSGELAMVQHMAFEEDGKR